MIITEEKIRHLTYDLTVYLLNFLLNIFFREVRPRGSHRIPKDGPVIFVVAPHANQFVDPILLMKQCGRRASFLIAEKSMHQKGVGFFARMVNAIPVIRPQDLVTKGKGTIELIDPLHILGTDTQFTKQCMPKDMILITGPKNETYKAEIAQVISDTELLLKKEVVMETSMTTNYKIMPHVEQDAVYQSVHDELNKGGCIVIFPEGGSHDRVEMLPLKAGVTLMALGAMAKYPGLDVKIVPVGLNYFHAHRFRSRAVIEFGEPITVSPSYVEQFKQGGQQKRQVCGMLLAKIYDALKSVTLNADSYETLMLVQAARRLYRPAHRKLHISQVVDLNRRFLIGYNMYKEDPKVIDMKERVMAYNQLLKYHGIKDHQVQKTELNGKYLSLLIIKKFFTMLFLMCLDFPGALFNLPVIIVANVISKQKADAALKSSSVKVAGRDVLATWKLLVSLVLVPSLYTLYSSIILAIVWMTHDYGLRTLVRIYIATWITIACISYASLMFGEISLDIAKSLKPLILSVLDPAGVETLRQVREKLSNDITDLINEYGPKAFSDFDKNYINKMSKCPTPIPSRSSSSSSFNLSSVKLPTLIHQTKEALHDHHLFNWSYAAKQPEENPGFLGISQFFGTSRSGSTTPTLQSRSSSFSAISNIDDDDDEVIKSIKIEDVYHIFKEDTFNK